MSALDQLIARKAEQQAEADRARALKNEQNRAYYQRNREAVLARNADWRKRNADPELDRMARTAYWQSRGKHLRKQA
jgi:hypothetical protein